MSRVTRGASAIVLGVLSLVTSAGEAREPASVDAIAVYVSSIGKPCSVVVLDSNNDGLLDILVSCPGRPAETKLFRGALPTPSGDPVFMDVTAEVFPGGIGFDIPELTAVGPATVDLGILLAVHGNGRSAP